MGMSSMDDAQQRRPPHGICRGRASPVGVLGGCAGVLLPDFRTAVAGHLAPSPCDGPRELVLTA